MGAEYLRGGDDCCEETGVRKCPRGSDFEDYFYDGSGNCVNGKASSVVVVVVILVMKHDSCTPHKPTQQTRHVPHTEIMTSSQYN